MKCQVECFVELRVELRVEPGPACQAQSKASLAQSRFSKKVLSIWHLLLQKWQNDGI